MAVRLYWLGVAVLGIAGLLAANALLYSGEEIAAADASYGNDVGGACPLGPRDGSAGRHERRSAQGGRYIVVAPRNYRPELAHPLLLVYAPAGFGPGLSERYAGLTAGATRAGFVVSYVGRLQMSLDAVERLAAVIHEITEHWCIDPERVYASGHSDGGTVATALAALPKYRGLVHGIAVSGAGWQKADFDAAGCGAPLPVLVMHGAHDSQFPGFGRDAAAYWSACNRCEDAGKLEVPIGACHRFRGCAAPTVYCEAHRSHWRWAGDPPAIMDFLVRQATEKAPSAAGPKQGQHPASSSALDGVGQKPY